MGARELAFADGGLIWLRVRHISDLDRFECTEVDGRKWHMDRNQAHLLYLYLQERLGLK